MTIAWLTTGEFRITNQPTDEENALMLCDCVGEDEYPLIPKAWVVTSGDHILLPKDPDGI